LQRLGPRICRDDFAVIVILRRCGCLPGRGLSRRFSSAPRSRRRAGGCAQSPRRVLEEALFVPVFCFLFVPALRRVALVRAPVSRGSPLRELS
jgi:hypothetical protein